MLKKLPFKTHLVTMTMTSDAEISKN